MSLKRNFTAASFSVAMAFNTSVASADNVVEHNVDNNGSTQQDIFEIEDFSEFLDAVLEEDNDELFATSITNEQFEEELTEVNSYEAIWSYIEQIEETSAYNDFANNSYSNSSLQGLIEGIDISPYYALPLIVRADDARAYLNPETLKILTDSGLDLNIVNKSVELASNGETHLYEKAISGVTDKLDNIYITQSLDIQGNGYEGLPQRLQESINEDITFIQQLKSYSHPDNTEITLDEILPRNIELTRLAAVSYQTMIENYSDASYKTPLYGRERLQRGDISNPYNDQATMTTADQYIKSSYGGDLESGIYYQHAQNLDLREQKVDYNLIVTEPKHNYVKGGALTHSIHGDATMRTAEALAVQISPDGEYDSDVYFVPTSNSFGDINTALYLANHAEGNTIFSRSYGERTELHEHDAKYNGLHTDNNTLIYNFYENAPAINFTAAGNEFNNSPYLLDESIDKFLATTLHASTVSGHTGNGVIIGAAHYHDQTGQPYISSYTSPGAAFLIETPDFYNAKIEGTSFSTPAAAEYYKEIAESYSDILTHDEIMFAALYSTNTDIYDVNMMDAQRQDQMNFENGVLSSIALDILGNEKMGLSPDSLEEFDKAMFRTNAAGIPYHERAGAGLLDVHKWKNNLEAMIAIKGISEYDAPEIKSSIGLKEAPSPDIDDSTHYNHRYEVAITDDMTLNKQSIYLDQTGLNPIKITSPSGMEDYISGSATGYVSTRAFTGEDVKAGDIIVIESTQPLSDYAIFDLRGYADGNTLQSFRSSYNTSGQALDRNAFYQGNDRIKQPDDITDYSRTVEAQVMYKEEKEYEQHNYQNVGPQAFQP